MPERFEPFDRALRRRRRDRAAAGFGAHAFLKDIMADEIAERLGDLGRRFDSALDLGCHDGRLGRRLRAEYVTYADAGRAFARAAGGVQCDEDRLPFASGAFDLVASAGSLHGVNDLPGAFAQVRRCLRPGGLFVASFVAGDTLSEIRAAFLDAESAVSGGAAARVMPMVDPAEAPSLLQRAGLTMPVVDIDMRTVRYATLFAALADVRGGGEGAILDRANRSPLRRDVLLEAARQFDSGEDKTGVRVQIIHLAAWAPGDTGALAEALKQRL